MIFGRFWRASGRRQEDRPVATRTVHVTISGRVQGVGYRAWTAREADRWGLSGWVCNRRDGSVEAVFSGEAEAVGAMLSAVHHGPDGARVDSVEASDYASAITGPFAVRPTY
jgi:acylphosphatase